MEHSTATEELLRQRAFLRKLARGLLGDDALAEDVVQEAELRGLRRGPAGAEQRGRLARWMATVTRRLALNARRSRERREAHEASAARPEAVPSHAEVLEGLELQGAVLAAVRELREPCRTAIWLRYYEDLAPAEIAERLGVPVATVKTRLRRALGELRGRLDRRSAHSIRERSAWASALLPLARGTGAPAPVATGTLGPLTVLGSLGGGLVMKKLACLLAALCLVWLGWRSWPRPEGSASAETRVVAPGALLERPDAIAGESAETTAAARVPVSLPGTPVPLQGSDGAELSVHVTWERGGGEAEGVGLTLWPVDDPAPDLHARARETGAAGRARFEGLAAGSYALHTDRETEERVELAAGEERALELVLPSGVDVEGLVIDGEGRPVADAEIWLEHEHGTGLLGGRVVARSAADGAFRLRSVGSQQALGAFAPGFAPAVLESLGSKAWSSDERLARVTLVLDRAPAGSPAGVMGGLRGRVLDPRGRPVPGALVALGARGRVYAQRPDGREVWYPRARILTSDAEGRFRAGWDGDAGSRLSLVHVLAEGFAIARAEIDPASGGEVEIRLSSGATIHGTVRDPGGRAVPGVTASVSLATGPVESACPFELPRARSGADGGFRLERVPPGEVELLVRVDSDPRRFARASLLVADGEEERLDLVLQEAESITGRAVDELGRGLAEWTILARSASMVTGVVTDELGAFVFVPPVKEGQETEWTLELSGGGGVVDRRDGVRPGDVVELVAGEALGLVSGEFVDAAGRVPAGERAHASLVLMGEGLSMSSSADIGPRGGFSFTGIAAGRYLVTVESGGLTLVRTEPFEVGAGEEVDLGRLASSVPGSLAVVCTPPHGSAREPSAIRVENLALLLSRPLVHESGSWHVSGLEPGRYRLSTQGVGLATHQEELEIRPGEETRLALELRAGVERTVRLEPAAGPAFSAVRVVLRDLSNGRELLLERATAFPGQVLSVSCGLAPGAYQVEASTDTGLEASGMLEVDPAVERAEFVLELR